MKTAIRHLTMEKVFELDAVALQKYISKDFKSRNKKFVQTDDFLYYSGTFPVLLVAHMDTVHRHLPTICKSANGNVWMAPEGIGGDDRCGIWIILNILQRFDCHVLFTQGEEIGGVGARAFASSGLIPEVNYMIEIDRQGEDDAVFYSCGNKAFKDFILDNTGYVESVGSFSDISLLSPRFDRASVNLSSGYYSPHSNSEYIKLSDMNQTMEVVELALELTDVSKVFKYEKEHFVGYYAQSGFGKKSHYHSGTYTPYGWDEPYDDYDYLPSYSEKYGKTIKLSDANPVNVLKYASKEVEEEEAEERKQTELDSMFLSTDDETYAELERQEKEDEFDQMLYDQTEMYLSSVTGYVVDHQTTLQVVVAVTDILEDAAYIPTWA